jgi:hypothetical protein
MHSINLPFWLAAACAALPLVVFSSSFSVPGGGCPG